MVQQQCYDCQTTETSKWLNKRDENGDIIGKQCRSCYRTQIEYPKEARKSGRSQGLPKTTINKIDHVCLWCNRDVTRGDWVLNRDINNLRILLNVICKTCYDHIVYNPSIAEREKASNKYRHYIRIEEDVGVVKYKEVKTDKIQRTGYCSSCTNNVFDGSCRSTNLRKMKDGALRELCVSCARSNQRFPEKDTKIELKVQRGLQSLGIAFEKHKPIRINNHWHQVDIFIEPNIAINIDGLYWHRIPENHQRDLMVDRELPKLGIKSIRLSESEVEHNINLCLKKILQAIDMI